MDNRELAIEVAMDAYARVRFGGGEYVRQWSDLNEEAATRTFAEMVSDLAERHVDLLARAGEYGEDEDHMEGKEGDYAVGTLNDEFTLSDWVRAEKCFPSFMCRFLGDKELEEYAEDCDEDGHLEYLLKKREEMLSLFRHSRRVAILARKLLNGEKVEQELSACLSESGY